MNQNQTFRISDKTLRISLIVGSVLLAVTILVLSIAVGAARQKEDAALTTAGSTLSTQQTTPPATEAGTQPDPNSQQALRLIRPVEGYLAVVHDTQTLSYSLTMQDYRTHTGIDIEAEQGAAVLAAASGTVLRTYVDPMMGYCIEIDHGDGYVTVYKNLDETLPQGIETGASVMGGQLIGAVGGSAIIEQAELPHLHFELLEDETPVDPLTYLTYEERAEE